MPLSTSMNIHGVKRVTIENERETKCLMDAYATRTIVIETDQGSIEITLFSRHKGLDDDHPYMDVIV